MSSTTRAAVGADDAAGEGGELVVLDDLTSLAAGRVCVKDASTVNISDRIRRCRLPAMSDSIRSATD
ncbi:hypothetical protein [Micromonospora inaquosa]|uniref:hypothetical protein n=1 Tax=Micromonospora inaquosa TaxID=2203716 RepID=UPI001ABF1E2E|nr:hypothetical protein [Micromonospora inaquosa]